MDDQTDPRSEEDFLIFTSLASSSREMITAQMRMQTILQANRIPFKGVDVSTNSRARSYWERNKKGRKLPCLFFKDNVVGDIDVIDDWNEFNELKGELAKFRSKSDNTKDLKASDLKDLKASDIDELLQYSNSIQRKEGAPPAPQPATKAAYPPAAPKPTDEDEARSATAKLTGAVATAIVLPLRNIAQEAAQKAKDLKEQAATGKSDTAPKEAATSKDKTEESPAAADKTEATAAPLKKEESKDSGASVPAISTSSLRSVADVGAGLQSPTTGAWKDTGVGVPLHPVQSPTSSSWKPTDVDPPIRSHRGSVVAEASPEEISAVEKEAAIQEVPGEEDSDGKKDGTAKGDKDKEEVTKEA